jgi:hypothetical protein
MEASEPLDSLYIRNIKKLMEYYSKNYRRIEKSELILELENHYRKITNIRNTRFIMLYNQFIKFEKFPEPERAILFDLNHALVYLKSLIKRMSN